MDEIDTEKKKKEEKKLEKTCQLCEKKLRWYKKKFNLTTTAGMRKMHVTCWMKTTVKSRHELIENLNF